MDDFNVVDKIRELAKSYRWQTIYVQSKELYGISLFQNNSDFTDIQIDFLNNLSFYYSLYFDIMLGDAPEYVIEDEIFEDAYNIYRNKERKKDKKSSVKEPLKDANKQIILSEDSFVFKRPKTRLKK